MDAPVIFPISITFPGIYAEIEVDPDTAADLERLWRAEGFGCVSVALAFPRDPADAGSANSWHPVGIYADLLLDGRSLLGSTPTRLKLGESERVRITAVQPPPRSRERIWPRPFAVLASDDLQDEIAEEELEPVRRKLVQLATTAPERLAVGYRDPGLLPDWLVDLGRRDVAAWRRVYMMAEVVLDTPALRHQALAAPALREVVQAVDAALTDLLAAGPTTTAAATVEAFLAEACDEHLQRTLDAVTAALTLGREGALDLPGNVSRPLGKLLKELDRLQERLYELTEALAEHSAPHRDDTPEEDTSEDIADEDLTDASDEIEG